MIDNIKMGGGKKIMKINSLKNHLFKWPFHLYIDGYKNRLSIGVATSLLFLDGIQALYWYLWNIGNVTNIFFNSPFISWTLNTLLLSLPLAKTNELDFDQAKSKIGLKRFFSNSRHFLDLIPSMFIQMKTARLSFLLLSFIKYDEIWWKPFGKLNYKLHHRF